MFRGGVSGSVATCSGSLIVHADGTVAGCTEDDEPNGCGGRDLRHEGDPIRCYVCLAIPRTGRSSAAEPQPFASFADATILSTSCVGTGS